MEMESRNNVIAYINLQDRRSRDEILSEKDVSISMRGKRQPQSNSI